jgi:hypothetical protein
MSSSSDCLSIIETVYAWDAFDKREIWVLQHFLNPFLLYMVTQNAWLSLLAIYVWESVEVLELTLCSGSTCLSGSDTPVTCAEVPGFVTDNLIGDVSQGVLGIFTAMMLRILLDIPDWSPSYRSLQPYNAVWFWWKRVIFWLALFLPSLLATFLIEHWYAALLHAVVLLGVFALFAGFNQTKREREAFWSNSKGVFQLRYYWTVYGVWAGYSIAMLVLCSYVPLGSSYQTFWIFLAISWIAFFIVGGLTGRLPEIVDFLSAGWVSIHFEGRYRFLANKKRFQNLPKLAPWDE